jgi:ubiquinone/menaquinone biosynthesis C-methylase UbiE
MNDVEYRKLAELEDHLWHFEALHDHVRRALEKQNLLAGAMILDAGCGTGGLLRRLARWFPSAQLRGVDIAPIAVQLAREQTSCQIDEASVTALPFADASFDVITSIDVLYHLERPAEALREYARCIRPGGLVVVNVPAYRWLWSYHDTAVNSFHRFTRLEVNALLREAGLQPIYTTYWNTFLFPAIVVRRKLLPPPHDGKNDVHDYPAWGSGPLRALLSLERLWLKTGLRLPFGCSVFAAGVRR